MKKALNFEIKTRLNGTFARTGVIKTPHGEIRTPAYIAGGTNATVPKTIGSRVDVIVNVCSPAER